MNPPTSRRARRLTVALTVLLLAGCGGLLPSPPERQLYRLRPAIAFAAPLPHVAAQLLVAIPATQSGLDTRRIALSRTPLSLDFFAGAEWSDRVPFLVQAALVQGFEKSGAVRAAGTEASGVRADFVLDTTVRDFEAVYDSPNAPPHVRVSLALQLVHMPDRSIVAHREMTRETQAAANAVPQVVAAFNGALGAAVEEAIAWTVTALTNPALPRPHG